MRQAFLFEKVVVLVGPWHERGNPPERGARVELRLLADEPWRGSPQRAFFCGPIPSRHDQIGPQKRVGSLEDRTRRQARRRIWRTDLV